jgi:CBS-domain-containing membrane protein
VRNNYLPLASIPLAPGTRVLDTRHRTARVTVDSPALDSMTDLAIVPAITIEGGRTLDEANRDMILGGVRMLFVVGPDDELCGLVTATDIMGEKPMRMVGARGIQHDEVLVADIMTPANALEVLDYLEVEKAKLGNIVTTLRNAGKQHALVVAKTVTGAYIRGLFSVTQIARDLGIAVQTPAIFKTFADIEAVMGPNRT